MSDRVMMRGSSPSYIVTLSDAAYQEIRTKLIMIGNAGTFIRLVGREAIEMGEVIITTERASAAASGA